MAAEDRVVLELLQTHTSLTSSNPILLLGQKVIVTGITDALSDPIKIGDGATAYTSLKWQKYELLKTIDLTSADVTYTLPKIIGGNQKVDIYWTNGGTYKMTLAVTNSETVGGIAAGTWEGEGTGHAVIVSDGTNWQVEVYEDSGSVADSGTNTKRSWIKYLNGKMEVDGLGATADLPITSAFQGGYRSTSQSLALGKIFIDTNYNIYGTYNVSVASSFGINVSALSTSSGTLVYTAVTSQAYVNCDIAYHATGRWRT